MSDDTTRADIQGIVKDAEALVSGYKTIGRALTNPQEVGMADLVLRLAAVVDRLVVPHMADGPEAPQAPKEDVGPGLRKAVAVLGRRLAGMDWGPQHKQAIVGCIEALKDAIVRGGEETPNQGGSPASQPVYVALFKGDWFERIVQFDNGDVASAFCDGWEECAEALRSDGKGYVLPAQDDEMRHYQPPGEVEKASRAWADAVQSDGVAEQKDGGR